jgi:hypothetical protein
MRATVVLHFISLFSLLQLFGAQPPEIFVRAIHASSTTPAVDIYVNSSKVLTGVVFGDASSFLPATEGSILLQVTAKDAPLSTAVITASATLTPSNYFTALAIGSGTKGKKRLQALLYADPVLKQSPIDLPTASVCTTYPYPLDHFIT